MIVKLCWLQFVEQKRKTQCCTSSCVTYVMQRTWSEQVVKEESYGSSGSIDSSFLFRCWIGVDFNLSQFYKLCKRSVENIPYKTSKWCSVIGLCWRRLTTNSLQKMDYHKEDLDYALDELSLCPLQVQATKAIWQLFELAQYDAGSCIRLTKMADAMQDAEEYYLQLTYSGAGANYYGVHHKAMVRRNWSCIFFRLNMK